MSDRGDDALQFEEVFMSWPEFFPEGFDPETQDARVLFGIDRKAMLKIEDAELSPLGVKGQFEFALLEDVPILFSKDGNQNLALEFIFDRVPIDVEEVGKVRSRPLPEKEDPPGVCAAHTHPVVQHP